MATVRCAGVSQDEREETFGVPQQPGSSTASSSPLAATEDVQGSGLREDLLPSLQLLDILRHSQELELDMGPAQDDAELCPGTNP